jgi:hypothetical protein
VPDDRYANLAPGAVAAALRSFARRYEEALLGDPARSADEQAGRRAADGRTVGDLVGSSAAALDALAPALHRVLVSNDPPLPDVAADPAAALPGAGGGSALAQVKHLGATASDLADRLGQAPTADLLRTGTTGSGAKVSAIDVARQAVRVVAENLLRIERAVRGPAGDDDE